MSALSSAPGPDPSTPAMVVPDESSTAAGSTGSATPATKASPARDRLLAAASETFYAEGITRTGVDRLIEVAGVTRATFYRHFPSKEDLVVAYVEGRDADLRRQAGAASAVIEDPRALLGAVVAGVGDSLLGLGFRGCPFINAAAEYPDAAGPVRVAIEAHRVWFRSVLVELLTASGHDAPSFAADLLVQLRDGAQVGAYLGDATEARATFVRGADGILGPA